MRLERSARGVWVLALIAVLLTGWTTLHETRRWRKAPFGDLNNLQTGGECLISGCDPYDYASLNGEAKARHEAKPEIFPMTPVYPSSSLLVLLPFEPLGWPRAAYVFNALAGLLTAAVCTLMAWRMRIRLWDPAALPMLAGLVCIPIVSAIEFANPALLDAALMTLACLLLLEVPGSFAGWMLLGIAFALKPQMAVGAVAVLLCRTDTRRGALKAVGLALALLLTSLLAYRLRLGSFHFLASLRWALWLSTLTEGSSDYANKESFDFCNIQGAFLALTHDGLTQAGRRLIGVLAWSTTGLLALAAAWLGAKRNAFARRPWTMTALAVAISLLPIYHRGYDRVIALVLLPAAVELAAQRRWLAWIYAGLLTLWIANDTIMAHKLKRWQFAPQNGPEDVAFCLVLLASLWLMRRRELDTIGE